MAYQGFDEENLIIEVTFRFGKNTEPWHHQCFRIAADRRPDITGHILSAWANVNNDFIESGLLLQHIREISCCAQQMSFCHKPTSTVIERREGTNLGASPRTALPQRRQGWPTQ